MDEELLSIGEVATRTGLSVKLIRHWSDLGLLDPAARTAAGYRRYDTDAVARLELARTLRDLGLDLATIRAVVTRQRGLAEVAAVHAEAIRRQLRTLTLREAVLRSVADRATGAEGITVMARLARLSAAERIALIEEFVTSTLSGVNPPGYRDALLSAMPELPDEPTTAQVDAWLELGELVRDPALAAALRRMAEYAAEHATADSDGAAMAVAVTDAWVAMVEQAMSAGLPPDSPPADAIVAEVIGVWLPSQHATELAATNDGARARARLLEQLELASDTRAERYWQLVCTVNGWPVRASLAAPGQWLITALRTNPEPGARASELAQVLESTATMTPESILDGCDRALALVEGLIAKVRPHQLGQPTPCGTWDVSALLNHLVYENLMWTSLALGAPRTDHEADHLEPAPLDAFRSAAAATRHAFHRPGLLDEQFGPAPGWRMVEQVLIEMLTHGWDLARATGQSTDLLPDVATALLPSVKAIYGGLPRTPGGSFAPEQPAGPDATPADRLAAFLGRPT